MQSKDYIGSILAGEQSASVVQFFCGEYFTKVVTTHPKFEELQKLFWSMEERLHKRFSRSKKYQQKHPKLYLTRYASDFFSNPNLENDPKILALQREILGGWIKDMKDLGFGVCIDWHNVFRSAYESGGVTKTNSDFDKIVSLQDIPRY